MKSISSNNCNSSSKEHSSSSSQRDRFDAKASLKEIKFKSPDELILGHLNINSIWNKFDGLKFVIDNNFDMFLVRETKFDDSFPKVQFFIEGLALLTHTIETLKVEDYSCISKKIYHPSVYHERLTMTLKFC